MFDSWKSNRLPGAVALAVFVGMWAVASASAGRSAYDRSAYVPGGSSRPLAAAIQRLGYERGTAAVRPGRAVNPLAIARRFSESAAREVTVAGEPKNEPPFSRRVRTAARA